MNYWSRSERIKTNPSETRLSSQCQHAKNCIQANPTSSCDNMAIENCVQAMIEFTFNTRLYILELPNDKIDDFPREEFKHKLVCYCPEFCQLFQTPYSYYKSLIVLAIAWSRMYILHKITTIYYLIFWLTYVKYTTL
jgi:hypothetical protein